MTHYRYIKIGEILRTSDEFHSSIDGKWITYRKFYNTFWEDLGYDNRPLRRSNGQVAVRRKIIDTSLNILRKQK